MALTISIVTGFVAFLHLYFLFFEMFAWESKGPKVFRGFPKEMFKPTKALGANMGLYNGFLAAGLIWTFFISNLEWQENISLFFLSCVSIAGIYGAISVDKKIFFIQAIPALIGIILIILS
jgi:putative membrane protein